MGRPPKVKPEEAKPVEKLVMIPETQGMGIGSDRDVVSTPAVKPAMTDPTWTAYFLSHLQENEKIKTDRGTECPTCDGLRRVFSLLVGDIIESRGTVRDCPNNQNMQRAVVEFTLRFLPFGWSDNITVSDGADISHLNAKAPYINYPVATAMTTAESRCLKKAAKLVKVLTADEMIEADEGVKAMTNDLIVNASMANATQVNIIKTIAERNKIDLSKLLKLLASDGLIQNTETASILYSEAHTILKELSAYQNGPDKDGKSIPDSILKS